MALHLVTGYAGKAHITAADTGAFNAGVFGNEDYIVNRGNKFAAVPITANTIKILDGEIILHGRHIRMEAGTYEEVTVENGTADYKRHDLICIRYTKDSETGIENASCVVVKGTPDASSAIDPNYNKGSILEGTLMVDFPLYRVPLDGLNVGALVPLFEAKDSLAGRTSKLESDKVDKVAGKGLSTNDYSNTEKKQVATNKANIEKLTNGTTPAGNALKLNGLTAEEFVNNENLLVNPYFLDPVNSSGKTEWTTNGTTIDGWKQSSSEAMTQLTENGIKTVNNSSTKGLQWLSSAYVYNILPTDENKKVTLSAKLKKSKTGFKVRVTAYGTRKDIWIPDTTEWQVVSATFEVTSAITQISATTDSGLTGGEWVEIEWIKLEVGSVATPFIPPNKETEKLKCGVADADTVDGYHASDFFPRAGGTIENTVATLLTLFNSNTNAGIARIMFKNANGNLGAIGMGTTVDSGLRRYNASLNKSYTMLDTGNMADHVLTKTGNGTLYGELTLNVNNAINGIIPYESAMILRNKTDTSTNTYTDLVIGDGVANLIKRSGGSVVSKNELLHTGNSNAVVVSETPLTAEGSIRVW